MVSLSELGAAGLALVVAAIAISIGATLNTSLSETTNCPYSWGSYQKANWSTGNGTTTNPLDSSWAGCCEITNGTYNASVCEIWYTGSVAMNTSYKGTQAMSTLGTWLPIIAIVVAAVIVIGLLVTYLGGLGSRM